MVATTSIHPLPRRLTLASEAFSTTIDFLMPNARADYIDLDQERFTPLVDAFYLGDPTADALVSAIRDSKGVARKQFDRALQQGINSVDDPLPEVAAFIASVDSVPEWIDEHRVEAGVRAFRRVDAVTSASVGWVMGFLFAAILPNSARSMATNARAVENSSRRYAETGRIGLDLLDLNGRGRYGSGTLSASRLRVLHASVRAYLRRSGTWDESVYGVPISASDTLGASLVNTATVLAAQRLGYRFSPAEIDGLAHYTALFAYRMGTPEQLIPRTMDAQVHALYFFLRSARGLADSESTRKLMRSLVAIELPGLPKTVQPAVRGLFHAYARLLFGDQLCTATGIPDSPLRALIPLGSGLIRPYELTRSRSRVLNRATNQAADLMWRRVMPRILSDEANYDADHVAKVVRG
jgi:hypothetical protein